MDIGLTIREWHELEYRDFVEMIEVHERKEISKWRHDRMLMAAASGVDPRKIMELPGDYEDIPLDTPERREEVNRILGAGKFWGKQGEA